jgi:hypothetical protein
MKIKHSLAIICFKRRRLVKYMILLPIIWFLYVILFGVGKETEQLESKDDKEIIMDLLKKIDQKNEVQQPPGPDNDHPIEERQKAEDQEKNIMGKLQLNAPAEANPNAPGLSKLTDFM